MSEEDSSKKSFVSGFKIEWSLFWHNFLGDAPEDLEHNANTILRKKLEGLSDLEIRALTKSWSQERQKLQLELEEVQVEFDENIKKIESLRLVGGELEETEEEVRSLSERGDTLSKKIQWLAERLDEVREFESLREPEAL